MSAPILRAEAAADVEEARRWHEARRQGLGDELLEVVGGALEFLETHAESAPVVQRDIRRQLLRRFPYGIFYRVVHGQVVVLACLHVRHDPSVPRPRR